MAHELFVYLCSLTLRSLVVALVAGVLLLRRRNPAARHAVWTVVLFMVLLLPLADAVVPRTSLFGAFRGPAEKVAAETVRTVVVLTSPVATVLPPSSGLITETAAQIPEWESILAILVASVWLALWCRLVLSYWRLGRIRRRSRHITVEELRERAVLQGIRQRVQVCESDSLTVPVTTGFLRPLIILPEGWRDWTDWKLRAVFIHELAHVRRRDWLVAVLAAVVRCAFWFNPLVWWLERHLSALSEEACDEASVRWTGDSVQYAQVLLEFATVARHGRRWIGEVAMARRRIGSRIERVLALQSPGTGSLSLTRWVLIGMAALPCLCLSAQARSPVQREAITVEEHVPVLPPAGAAATAAPKSVLVAASTPETTPPASSARPETQTPAATAAQSTEVLVPAQSPQNYLLALPETEAELREYLMKLAEARSQGGLSQCKVSNPQESSAQNMTRITPDGGTATETEPFTFDVTEIRDRTVFMSSNLGTFSFRCDNCSFSVWRKGVGSAPERPEAHVVLELSANGRTLTATCRSTSCLVAVPPDPPVAGAALVIAKAGETIHLPALPGTCFRLIP